MSSALHLSCQEDGEDENVLQDCMPTEEDLQRVVFKQFHELDVGGRCAVAPPPVPGYESDSPTASPRSIGRVAPPPLSPPGRAEPGGDDASPEDLSGSPRPAATPAETAALFQVPDIPLYASDSGKTFQRVHIDEADDATEGEDVHVGAAKIKRALDLHLEWTASERRVGQAKRAAPPPSPKRDGYRREPPAYQPLDAYHHAVSFAPLDASGLGCDAGVWAYAGDVSNAGPSHPSAESMSATRLRRQTRPTPSLRDFALAFDEIKGIVNAGPVKSLAFKRLAVLEQRFNLHVLLNGWRELSSQKSVPHRDFYNVRKVDTHVHHSACMNQKHLLRFIKSKLRKHGNEIVTNRDGHLLTLADVFKSLKLTAYDLSIDTLDMHAHDTFHRFDRFNLKYNPAGQSRLREIFLKTDNHVRGRYLAELTKEVINDLEASKYQLAEWRVSVYGRKRSEWAKLADWFYDNRLSSPNVRWMIQVPRLYAVYRASGLVETFDEVLANIFAPLFENTLDPSSNPKLHAFLEAIVGFDSVDDESKPDGMPLDPNRLVSPGDWNSTDEPAYGYWMYHLYANLRSLNGLRRARGLSTFEFRPHCGEAGDVDHLVAAFLLTTKINHGVQLRRSPALQYLYYLAQLGVAMSPLSNNRLFLDFAKSPFPKYFKRGLNISLSTDDPLMLHFTKDPLVEEYSVAAQVWKLSSTDICEIARTSVLQSGVEDRFKRHFLGDHYDAPGAAGNDIRMTNVPDIRVMYRHETLTNELAYVAKLSSRAVPPPPK